ncbi:2OG-Fe(II) oxygenase [Burkholderia cenocepacia]
MTRRRRTAAHFAIGIFALDSIMSKPMKKRAEVAHAVIDLDETALRAAHLLALCNGDALAIRIHAFAPPAVIRRAGERLFSHPERGALGHATEFTRLGIAYAEIRSDEVRRAYHAHALDNIQRVRTLFGELASPVDRFRTLLDDTWPEGARLLSVDRQKCFVGVCRYQTPGVDLEPHIDNLEWTLPKGIDWKLRHQLSANIYLQVPPRGGELELWNIEPDAHEYAALQGDRRYGISRRHVSDPDVVVKPEVGDLIILNPRFIHAVRPVEEQDRVTLSAFVGVKSETEPLVYWS